MFREPYKPGGKNTIVLIDFGYAEYFGDHKYNRYYCGTKGYFDPFLYIVKKLKINYGPEIDLYSMGSLFYVMVTGRKLYEGFSREIAEDNKRNNYDLRKINNSPDIPSKLKDLIKKLLAPYPQKIVNHYTIKNVMAHPYFDDITWGDNNQLVEYKNQ